jgi:hypothetical protein
MQNMFAGLASKKLMLVAAVIGIVIHNAEAQGWQWWHAISVAICSLGYCVAQAFDDGMRGHGSELPASQDPEKKP